MNIPNYKATGSFREFCYYFLLAPGDESGDAIITYKLHYLVGFLILFPYSIYLAHRYRSLMRQRGNLIDI